MSSVVIKDLNDAGKEGQYFVSTCSHVNESDEIDSCAKKRLTWLNKMHEKGLRVKVAFLAGEPAGFLHLIPIEHSIWGPIGKDLMVLPCMYVLEEQKTKGLGKALLQAAEEETKKQGKKALVTYGYYGDFWFMPASFFEKHGFSAVALRKVVRQGEKDFLDEEVILWKVFDETAESPQFLTPRFEFRPVEGKVVVDLFSDVFCKEMEAQRVREVVKEFGDKAILNEYPAENRGILLQYQIFRAIFVNGKEIGWGYEAPREGIRKAIKEALKRFKDE
ncbi:MAG: GNAT family N-acetyltransferase [Candidatus Hodarchaeota archaeon]